MYTNLPIFKQSLDLNVLCRDTPCGYPQLPKYLDTHKGHPYKNSLLLWIPIKGIPTKNHRYCGHPQGVSLQIQLGIFFMDFLKEIYGLQK